MSGLSVMKSLVSASHCPDCHAKQILDSWKRCVWSVVVWTRLLVSQLSCWLQINVISVAGCLQIWEEFFPSVCWVPGHLLQSSQSSYCCYYIRQKYIYYYYYYYYYIRWGTICCACGSAMLFLLISNNEQASFSLNVFTNIYYVRLYGIIFIFASNDLIMNQGLMRLVTTLM